MKRTDRRSDCPTNFALEHIGDSWTLLIVRDLMFKGKHTYAEFAESEERISSSVLAARLRALTDAGIVRRSGSGRSTRYFLTRKGADLLPLMVEMNLWSATYDADTAAPNDFVRRVRRDRQAFLAEMQDRLAKEHGIMGRQRGAANV